MATGKVKWFSNSRGYGFIVSDEGGDELFAHYSAVMGDDNTDSKYKSLEENSKVSFDVIQGPKGKQASNIRRIQS